MLKRHCTPSRSRIPRVLAIAAVAGVVTGFAIVPRLVDQLGSSKERIASYRFYCGRDGVIVISAGPDKAQHTDDDITSY